MKILKSYYKTPSFLTGRCIVSLAILGLISCSDRNGKSLSEATNDPAGIYREYLYNIRCQKDSSFQVLTKHILQWQTVKDSVFRYLRNDTLSHSHSNQREECIRLHDSIRTEFSRLALSKTRTYQELLALKGEFSPYNNDEELHHAAGEIRPFFNSLDNLPLHKGNKEEILAAYRMLLTRTVRNGIHSRNELITYITKEDAIFRAFLSHLHDFEGESMADITRGTEQCCSQIFFAAERKEITYREAMLYLTMRTNRRQIQNMQICIEDVRNKKIKTSSQAHAYIWMLIHPYTSLDGFSMTLLSDKERKQLDRMAAQTPVAFKTLSRILQLESGQLTELPGMLMDIFIQTL